MHVRLGATSEESIAATVLAIVDRAVARDPAAAAALAGTVLRLGLDGHPRVLVRFASASVEVTDDDGSPADVEIAGALEDLNALLVAPLAGGIPSPVDGRGRAALARLSDGRIAVRGSKLRARRVLRLLSMP